MSKEINAKEILVFLSNQEMKDLAYFKGAVESLIVNKMKEGKEDD